MNRAVLVALLVWVFMETNNVVWAQGASQSTAQVLSQLEDRLFEHNYDGGDTDARLNRLEQFVFGESESDSIQERLSHLQSAITETKSQDANTSSINGAESKHSLTPVSDNQPNRQNAAASMLLNYSDYPRVGAVEQQLVGKTYSTEPLSERLARLEKVAFGKTSSDDDLSHRVDRLEQYAQQHDLYNERRTNRQLVANNQTPAMPVRSEARPENPFGVASQQAYGCEKRIAAMETAVFGHEYPKRPLEERVEHLEKRMIPYGHDLANKDLPGRVDHLWTILSAANSLPQPPLSANSNSSKLASANGNDSDTAGDDHSGSQSSPTSADTKTTGTQDNAAHHSWLHKLGKVLAAGETNTEGAPYYPNPGFISEPGMTSTGIWLR